MDFKQELINLKNAILNSYSQIFFSDNKLYAILLLLVSFIDFYAGITGIIAVLASVIASNFLGFDKSKIIKGVYGFNPLMVGLGLGIYFQFSPILILIVVIISIFTLFLNVALEGVIGKYYLPYLSIPFLISIWVVTLASQEFTSMGVSQRGVYLLNDLYAIGGDWLVNSYNFFNELPIPKSIKTYFISLGAIFFQYNLLAGILIAIGLLFVSRISFILSILGFFSAFVFYRIIGSDISNVTYSYIGFNYILTSIAIGGFFLVPSKKTYLWVLLLIPLVAILTISLTKIFAVFGLSIFSLPFNITVLLFLYVLKLRLKPDKELTEVVIQQNSPEKNLYSFLNANKRFNGVLNYVPVRLPFWGEWNVSQGHNGKLTHKDNWKHAWDFIITDVNEEQHNGSGKKCEDYFCYDKAVLAPFAGYVVEIEDGIEDNKIGEKNLDKNWGNTIIIKYSDLLYAKLSHLKKDSFLVQKGDLVTSGQVIANSGSSGNSPVPHLHFQLQATPYIGSTTLEYPIGYFVIKNELKPELNYFEIPKQDDIVYNLEKNETLENAYRFTSGQKINFKTDDIGTDIIFGEWDIYADIFNNQYLYCKKSNSFAYFTKDDSFFYFNRFVGNKKSLLYYFYLANYKVNFGFLQNLEVVDSINPQTLFPKYKMIFQDIIAPFYMYLKAEYRLKYLSIDTDFTSSTIELESEILKQNILLVEFKTTINQKGINKFVIIEEGNERVFTNN